MGFFIACESLIVAALFGRVMLCANKSHGM